MPFFPLRLLDTIVLVGRARPLAAPPSLVLFWEAASKSVLLLQCFLESLVCLRSPTDYIEDITAKTRITRPAAEKP